MLPGTQLQSLKRGLYPYRSIPSDCLGCLGNLPVPLRVLTPLPQPRYYGVRIKKIATILRCQFTQSLPSVILTRSTDPPFLMELKDLGGLPQASVNLSCLWPGAQHRAASSGTSALDSYRYTRRRLCQGTTRRRPLGRH